MMRMDRFGETRKSFLVEVFTVMKFWHTRKLKFPNLCAVIARASATPVSYSANERVFSVLKLFVDEKRSRLSTFLVDEMLLARSLHK